MKNIHIKYQMKLIIMVFLDIISVIISYSFGLLARFDFLFSAIETPYLKTIFPLIITVSVLTLVSYAIFRLYHMVWRFASLPELYRIVEAYILIGVIILPLNQISLINIPKGSLLIGFIVNFFLCVLIRFGYRMQLSLLGSIGRKKKSEKKVLIIGAGQAAQEIIRDINESHRQEYYVVGLIDDNQMKKGRFLEGIKIIGDRNQIASVVENEDVDLIIFAISNIDSKNRREILNLCNDTGCQVMTVPDLYQIYSGEVKVSRLKTVEIEDLLAREEIKVDSEQILRSFQGKIVMVTGGGGSIGSELCRQIVQADPELLIIFDIYENTTYEVQQELRRHYPDVQVIALIGDVADRIRIRSVIETYHPDIIFHAAAHKHVPLMEDSPNEAIKNNVIGTRIICEEAIKGEVKKFLLISTDKAVNPTNIMGASKRLCEMIIQMMARRHTNTVFGAVRFGNVLGSNGSVIPLFKKQIAEGGPVTVTDPNIIRYFMTIPEAVSLVLQASYYAKGGEIFVLDMGKPVKIADLARNLIKLSGYKPDEDIKIVYTGLRPGEKLYEELLMNEEGMNKTENDLIFIGHPIEMDDIKFIDDLNHLELECQKDSRTIETEVARIVPTYNPSKSGS